MRERFAVAELDWIVPCWDAPSKVQAFVTTRSAGAGRDASVPLDLGRETWPGNDDIAGNRRRAQVYLPGSPRWLEQVHGTGVVRVARGDAHGPPPPKADAAVTRDVDTVLAVRIADCLPVLFSATDGSVIGIAHAGWRGLAAGVLETTLRAMDRAPSDIVAWLGPCIGPTAFEVGPDVEAAFAADGDAVDALRAGRPGKWHADLHRLARRRLARAGVPRVDALAACTATDAARFFSFRRDHSAARMAAFIWRTG